MSETAELLWWIFVATSIAVVVLVAGLAVAMVRAQQRVVALHRSYLQRLVRAHEEERSRVAREVHDDAVQRLAYLGRELDLLHGSSAEAGAQGATLRGIRSELDDLADALRQLAHQLHPSTLEHGGLNAALTQFADETQRLHDVQVELELPPREPELDDESRLAAFRIAQEAVRNVVRHAAVGSLQLKIAEQDGVLELVVADRGKGFDVSDSRRHGIGVVSIEERARLAGGVARVDSIPARGTTVTARIPARVQR